jgi:hypothetical protein
MVPSSRLNGKWLATLGFNAESGAVTKSSLPRRFARGFPYRLHSIMARYYCRAKSTQEVLPVFTRFATRQRFPRPLPLGHIDAGMPDSVGTRLSDVRQTMAMLPISG